MTPASHARLAAVAGAAFLILWPLTLQKPGLPYAMKADEPAYYLMARSLWEDGDLVCEPRDLLRLSDDFFHPAENLILMTRDGWLTSHFAKPWFGSALAAPAVAAFGANGFVAFNMALLLASAWMGAVFLARANGRGLAAAFATGFFFLSAGFQYVFWLQPETSTAFFVTAALFLALHESEPAGRLAAAAWRGRWWLAGLAMGPVVSAKPPYGLFLFPLGIAALRARRLRGLAGVVLGAAVATGTISLVQHGLTGAWSPYLGTLRRGFVVENPNVMPTGEARRSFLAEEAARPGSTATALTASAGQEAWDVRAQTGSDWSWVFGLPEIPPERIPVDVLTFFLGRHTGAFVYYPFLLAALLAFAAGGGWRDPARWGILAAFAGLAAFLLLWNFENYHGGGGFVGNRYLASVYPAALFLVARLRPAALLPAAAALAGLFVGPIVFAPLGPPVDEPTLQAYARGKPFEWLPYEVNLGERVPGQRGIAQSGAWIKGRKDRVVARGDWITVLGRGKAELWLRRDDEPEEAAFLLRNHAPGNDVTVRMGRGEQRVAFPAAPPPPEGTVALVVLRPGRPERTMREYVFSAPQRFWRLTVEPRRAARPSWWGGEGDDLVGVSLLYLGTRERLERPVYGVTWLDAEAPDTVAAGGRFSVRARLRNSSGADWTLDSPAQVRLGYRWRSAAGGELAAVPLRTALPRPLARGEEVDLAIEVMAPAEAGVHTLVLEPVYEHVRWFGEVDPSLRLERTIRVESAAPGTASSGS